MRSNAPRCVCVYPSSAILGLARQAPGRLCFATWDSIFFRGKKDIRLSAGNDHLLILSRAKRDRSVMLSVFQSPTLRAYRQHIMISVLSGDTPTSQMGCLFGRHRGPRLRFSND